jgi:selenocysteine lyase/cysteine desulfurase
VGVILGFEGGIGVRNGCVCAHSYLLCLMGVKDEVSHDHRSRVLFGDRSGLPRIVRVSFGCCNTSKEADALIPMLECIAEGSYEGDYVVDTLTGDYLPRGFDLAQPDHWFSPHAR